jgi:hypothetical protein
MKNFKELALVIGLLLVVAALVFAHTINKNRFSESTQHIAETIKNEPAFVEAGNLKSEDYFVVELVENPNEGKFSSTVKVTFEGLTDKNFRKQLDTSGKKILLTGEESQTAKAWVILNQLGIENLFILTDKENPELLRYTFKPDTTKKAVIE